ncbi:HPP family protein [Tistrella mobilis]|uniref:HPP family protein n=1 Tax=Tistrella mobilis TaxID=171437 RepID=UPI00355859CF
MTASPRMSSSSRRSRGLKRRLKARRRLAARIFTPILPGATVRARAIGAMGALTAVAVTSLVAHWILGPGWHLPVLVAPTGASAVLLFVLPSSPMAQPWPIVGGTVISALVGIATARLVPDATLAAGLAVAAAIGMMSVLRCLHPPGGAVALSAVLGGPTITETGFAYAFVPLGLNALILVATGFLFHRLSGQHWPLRAAQPASQPVGARRFTSEDIAGAVDDMGTAVDISREDLETLIRRIEARAASRLARESRTRRHHHRHRPS